METLHREDDSCCVLNRNNFTIQTSKREFKVCEYLLSKRSLYFAALFGSPWLESCTRRIFYDNFDDKIIAGILSFLYTGIVVECSIEDLIPFSIASDYFLVEDLRDILHEKIRQTVDVDNVLNYYSLANKFRNSFFEKLVREIILENAQELFENCVHKFYNWSMGDIQQILISDQLCATEEMVLSFLRSYCRHNRLNIADYCYLIRSLPSEYSVLLSNSENNPELQFKILEECYSLTKHLKSFTKNRKHFVGSYRMETINRSRKHVYKRFTFSHRVSINQFRFHIFHSDFYYSLINTETNQKVFGMPIIADNSKTVGFIFDFENAFLTTFYLKLYFTTTSDDVELEQIQITSYAHTQHKLQSQHH